MEQASPARVKQRAWKASIERGVVGAKATESQVHRELASGLSMPVGFKNGSTGNVKIAVDAIRSAAEEHWFDSVTKQGVAAIFQTTGNPDCRLILRGGSSCGPNYDAESVADAVRMLKGADTNPRPMIDCSHANSGEDHRKQLLVAADVAQQIAEGNQYIYGVMLESHLKGRCPGICGWQSRVRTQPHRRQHVL